MNKTARWALVVVAAQAALIGVYWLVEHQRGERAVAAFGTAPPQRVDLATPPLTLRRRDGSTTRLLPPTTPTVLHIWATWCPPCRTELPSVLALPSEHAVDVVTIALDPSWQDVAGFLDDQALGAAHAFLADSAEVERALSVRSLPVTFVISASGRVALRFNGARDWSDGRFVAGYLGELSEAR